MELIEKLIYIMSIEQDEPATLGGLYMFFLLAVVFSCVLSVKHFSGSDDKIYRVILGIAFLVMLAMEVSKQIVYPMSIADGEIIYDYPWHILPFQLCSTPLYVLPLAVFFKDGYIRRAAIAYVMTYSLIGGIAVYVVPTTVFDSRIVLSIQSLVHHGLQIVVGVYTAAYYRKRICTEFFLGGAWLFAITFTVANFLNTVGYDLLVLSGLMDNGAAFNMFFVSPRSDQTTPMFSEFLGSLPPMLYICAYFTALNLGAIIIMALTHRIAEVFDGRIVRNIER